MSHLDGRILELAATPQMPATQIAATLPADTDVVIDRLSSLRELPDGAWKLHAGDLAHGEAVNLDESDWQPIANGSKAPKDAVWFRQTYQIPATLNRGKPSSAFPPVILMQTASQDCIAAPYPPGPTAHPGSMAVLPTCRPIWAALV